MTISDISFDIESLLKRDIRQKSAGSIITKEESRISAHHCETAAIQKCKHSSFLLHLTFIFYFYLDVCTPHMHLFFLATIEGTLLMLSTQPSAQTIWGCLLQRGKQPATCFKPLSEPADSDKGTYHQTGTLYTVSHVVQWQKDCTAYQCFHTLKLWISSAFQFICFTSRGTRKSQQAQKVQLEIKSLSLGIVVT